MRMSSVLGLPRAIREDNAYMAITTKYVERLLNKRDCGRSNAKV